MSENSKNSEFSSEDMLKVARAKTGNTGGESETREVVVQDDGSKIVRVKRRRKKKTNATNDIISSNEADQAFHLKLLLWFVIGLVALAAVVAGIIFFRIVSLNSSSEIVKLQDSAEKAFIADVSIKGYRVGAKKTKIDHLSISNKTESAHPYSVEIKNISVPLKPELLLLGKLKGDSPSAGFSLLKVNSAFFQNERLSHSANLDLPYTHKNVSVEDANLIWGNSGKEKHRFTISNAEGKFSKRDDQTLQAIMRKGIISNSGTLPPVLSNAIFVFDKDKITIQSLVFGDGDVGKLSLSGEYMKDGEGEQEIECKIEKMQLQNLHPHLKTLLEARITTKKGTAKVSAQNQSFSINSDFQASKSGFVLKSFQFLHDISSQIGSLAAPSANFGKLSQGTIEITEKGYHFSNLNFESISNLALMGDFDVDVDGKVSGALSVGIPVSKIKQAYPEVNETDFNVARGFVWIPTNISGTVDLPKDDFWDNFKKEVLKR